MKNDLMAAAYFSLIRASYHTEKAISIWPAG